MNCSRSLAMLALFLATACSGDDDGAREVGTKKANESVQDVERLVIRDGLGDVDITGVRSLSLEVHAKISTTETSKSKDGSAMSEVSVQPEAEPDAMVLDFRWKLPEDYRAKVDIDANKRLRLEINDRAGDIHVSDWEGRVIIKDGSGDVILDNVEEYKIDSKSSGKLVVDGKEEIFE